MLVNEGNVRIDDQENEHLENESNHKMSEMLEVFEVQANGGIEKVSHHILLTTPFEQEVTMERESASSSDNTNRVEISDVAMETNSPHSNGCTSDEVSSQLEATNTQQDVIADVIANVIETGKTIIFCYYYIFYYVID